MRDKLTKPVIEALREYLAFAQLEGYILTSEEPIWLSFARNDSRGGSLSIQSLANICEKRLGTSKFHTLRHTFAHMMEDAGAKVSDIQARLGHSSIQTTGIYLAAL